MWDFIVWVVCERECEDSSAYWRKWGFRRYFERSLPTKWVTCKTHDWNAKSHDSWFSRVRPSPRDTHETFYFAFLEYLLHHVFTHYIYPHYPYIERSAFQRENPKYNPWELEIVMPTILYTIFCGFSQLPPFHIQILERLITQTLTTPILSVKWGFGAVGKYWKKPFVWWMQSGWIAWFRELEKVRLHQVNW